MLLISCLNVVPFILLPYHRLKLWHFALIIIYWRQYVTWSTLIDDHHIIFQFCFVSWIIFHLPHRLWWIHHYQSAIESKMKSFYFNLSFFRSVFLIRNYHVDILIRPRTIILFIDDGQQGGNVDNNKNVHWLLLVANSLRLHSDIVLTSFLSARWKIDKKTS